LNFFEIKSVAVKLPKTIHENDSTKFASITDIPPGWHSFWGVKKRRHIEDSSFENEISLAVDAATEAIGLAEIEPEDIDLILSNYSCPAINDTRNAGGGREILPRVSVRLRDVLGCDKALCRDIELECLSFLMNLQLAQGLVASGRFANVLVCASERLSSTSDFSSKWSTIFSDGAAAAVVSRSEVDKGFRFLGAHWGTNSEYYDLGLCQWRSPEFPTSGTSRDFDMYVTMGEGGDQTMKLFIPRAVPNSVFTALDNAQLEMSDIDYFIFHQPSNTLVSAWAAGLGLKEGDYLKMVEEYGCMGSVASPHVLHTALKDRLIAPGDKVSFAGACTGWSFVASLWQFGEVRVA